MNNKRYVGKFLELNSGKAIGKVRRSLIKATTLAALSFSILGIGEALTLFRPSADQSAAYAQQVPDITADTTTGTNVLSAPNASAFSITGGTLKGDNLFHSFETFSPGDSYTLFNLSDSTYDSVDNVFSRITGSSDTFINGQLQLEGGDSPNLFLLNPNGISIGPGASINVPASFFVTTAEQISFEDGTTFSAANPSASPLLTVSAPIGLQFGAAAESINWESQTFFKPNEAITLLGGDINIQEGGIGTNSGLIQLGSVAANSQVEIDAASHELTYRPDTAFQDISIHNSITSVAAIQNLDNYVGGSGHLSLRGRNITVQSSRLFADNYGPEDGGTTDIRASETLDFRDSRATTTLSVGYTLTPSDGLPYTVFDSEGNGGSIYIEAENFVMRPTAESGADLYQDKIGADTYSDGRGGNITIDANTISLFGDDTRQTSNDGIPSLRIVSNSFERGGGGVIAINAENMLASGGAGISSTTFSAEDSEMTPGAQSGAGGNIFLNVAETLTFDNGSQVITASRSDADAGNISIKAREVVLLEQDIDPLLSRVASVTSLTTSSTEDGNGGDINIDTDSLRVFGTANIQTSSLPLEPRSQYGNAGNLTITADSVSVENGGRLSTGTFTNGAAGDLTIRADELRVAGKNSSDPAEASLTTIVESAAQFSTGAGGNLLIEVDALTLESGGQISAGTFSDGDAGELTVRASSRIDINGFIESSVYDNAQRTISSGIFNSSASNSSGNSGNLSLTTPQLSITNGAEISVRTAGSGNGGNIAVKAGEILVADPVFDPLDDSVSGITATVSSMGSGTGGTLNLESDRLHIYNGGQISASSDGAGSAGSVVVRANEVLIEGAASVDFDGQIASDAQLASAISSRSTTGFDAGSVDVSANRIELRDRGTITVSNTAGGSAGNVNLAANSIKLNNGSVQAEANAGSQGNLNVNSRDTLLLRNGSRLSANATETATGGNVAISAPLIIGTGNSDISANAVEGDGGNIRLVTQGLVGLAFRDQPTSDSDITASSELGVSGTVDIESPDTETDSGLVQLPENLEDASNQVVASCAAQDGNQFTSTGRGGLPGNPLGLLTSNRPWADFSGLDRLISSDGTVAKQDGTVAQSETIVEEAVLQEAGAWQISETGDVELLATSRVGHSSEDCLEGTLASAF